MKRRIGLILLLLGGSGSLLYGSLFHKATVDEEGEREVSIAVSALPGLGDAPSEHENLPVVPPEERPGAGTGATADDVDPFGGPSVGGAAAGTSENPFENSAAPGLPGVRFEKVKARFVEAREEPEWVIVRDVTVGGVVRLANGQLKRTYSGKAPSLCPT
jgi:hypothetical protein